MKNAKLLKKLWKKMGACAGQSLKEWARMVAKSNGHHGESYEHCRARRLASRWLASKVAPLPKGV